MPLTVGIAGFLTAEATEGSLGFGEGVGFGGRVENAGSEQAQTYKEDGVAH
jgi:hypothetical protein